MFFHSKNEMCGACGSLFHWLKGLTLLVIGVLGLLQQLNVFLVSPWGWAWPIIVLVWALVVLFNVGCKECK